MIRSFQTHSLWGTHYKSICDCSLSQLFYLYFGCSNTFFWCATVNIDFITLYLHKSSSSVIITAVVWKFCTCQKGSLQREQNENFTATFSLFYELKYVIRCICSPSLHLTAVLTRQHSFLNPELFELNVMEHKGQ